MLYIYIYVCVCVCVNVPSQLSQQWFCIMHLGTWCSLIRDWLYRMYSFMEQQPTSKGTEFPIWTLSIKRDYKKFLYIYIASTTKPRVFNKLRKKHNITACLAFARFVSTLGVIDHLWPIILHSFFSLLSILLVH